MGDAAASLVGQRWGKHRYRVFGHARSWEGTATMGIASLLAVGTTLFAVPGSVLSPTSVAWPVWETVAIAACGTAVATAAEALSPAGTDNLSVPLLSGLAMYVVEGTLASTAG